MLCLCVSLLHGFVSWPLLLLFEHAFGVVFSILVLCTDTLLTVMPSAAVAPFS